MFQEGTIFPGVKLFSRGRLVVGHLPHGDGQLARAEDGRGRHQRARGRRAHRRRGADARRRAPRARARSATASRACTTTARRSCARWFEQAPRRPLRRPRRDGLQRHRRRPRAVRGRARGRRLARCGIDYTGAPPRQAGPINCPLPVHGVGQPHRHRDARGRRRGAERGPLPRRSRSSRGRARCSTPSRPRRASSTAGPATRRSRRSTSASRRRCPRPCPPASGGDICALVWWGEREGTGEPWTDGVAAPDRPGRARARRRRERA